MAGVVKQINGTNALRAAPAGAITVFRKYWPDDEQNRRIASMAVDATLQDLLQALGGFVPSYVEVWNEVAQRQGAGLEQHADFLAAFIPKAHAAGLKVAGFSFSTGNPGSREWHDPDDFQYLYNRQFCACDAIAMHDYWGPPGFDRPYAERYRALHDAVPNHPQFLITEGGRDAVEGGGRGWKSSGITAEQYIDELRDYKAELDQDSYVLAFTPFTATPTVDWAAFDTDELTLERFFSFAPAPPPATAPATPQGGSTLAVTPTIDDQGPTYECGAFGPLQWVEGLGFSSARQTAAFAKYKALADQQQGLAFNQAHDLITELAAELDAELTWLGDGYLRDFATFDQAVRDGWCVTIGVQEAVLQPGQNYYHYIDVYGLNGANFQIADSFHKYDGETGTEPVQKVHQAIADNWDDVLVGVAFRMSQAPVQAPPATTPDEMVQVARSVLNGIVTKASVAGDYTYLTPPNLEGVQELMQSIKHDLGA